MSLIKCPECNKQISDKATACPNCGYPLTEQNKENHYIKEAGYICDFCGDGFDIPYSDTNLYYSAEKQEYLCPNCGKPMWYLMSSIVDTTTDKTVDTFFDESRNVGYNKLETKTDIPKCPICGSTNLSKLSTLGKAAKIGLFGIFGAGDIGKTWKCKDCGSKF